MDSEHKEEKGVTGLANMRNTCYLNSSLQALRHNTELTSFFLEGTFEKWISKKENKPNVELVRGYADLVKVLWSGSKPAFIRPAGFIQAMMPAAVKAGFEQFTIPIHHDSHEFLGFMLDQLHEGMAEEVNIQITRPQAVTEEDKIIDGALNAWKNYFNKSYSPLIDMIYGLMCNKITCKSCKKSIYNWDTFNCLKLSISSNNSDTPTIESMLKSELKEEEIDFTCEVCKSPEKKGVRSSYIWRLPRMVIIVIKRFTYDGNKITTKINFNLNPIEFSKFFSYCSPEPSKHSKYECFATVDHIGSAKMGHYISQAKSPLYDKWNLFDDETTHSISEPRFGENTYILFFKQSR